MQENLNKQEGNGIIADVKFQLPSDIDNFLSWAKRKCQTDDRGNWQLAEDGILYIFSTQELYKEYRKRGN